MAAHPYSIVPASAYASMPWKNGLGTTAQIAIHPAGATLADFEWRISSAEVRGSNPFSIFDGYQRILVLLTSNSICQISHPGHASASHPPRALVPYEVYHFSGAWSTHCEVTPPPNVPALIKDFNLIFKSSLSCNLVVHRVAATDAAPLTLRPPPSTAFYFVFCAEGEFTVDRRDTLSRFASLRCDAPPVALSIALAGTGVIFEVIVLAR